MEGSAISKASELPRGSTTDLSDLGRDVDPSLCILPDEDISNIEDELQKKLRLSGAVKRIKRLGSDHERMAHVAGASNTEIESEKEDDGGADVDSSERASTDHEDEESLNEMTRQVNNLNISKAHLSAEEPAITDVTMVAEEEDEVCREEWRKREKHVFVLSRSGKPIYSRYGDENHLATIMGVMLALVSVVADSEDVLKTIVAGEHKFVFLVREHLILVCVCCTYEATSHLLLLLNYVYQQILSILTYGTMSRQFTRHRNLDLRRLLTGSERFLDGVIDLMEKEMGLILGAVRCLPLAGPVRDNVVQSITQGARIRNQKAKDGGDLVFAILLADNQLVTIVRMKPYYPHPLDLHLLINIVRSSESFKNAQSWTPICLPKFDADGFLYAYISYLDERSCLILLTVGNSEFYTLHECRERIVERMTKTGCLQAITEACASSGYTVKSAGISDLRHFLYKSKATAQYTSPRFEQPYAGHLEEERRVTAHYYRLHHLIHNPNRPMKLIYQVTATETYLGWNTDNFEMYATFSPLITKPVAISAVNKLMKWVQNEKEKLFILTSPTF